MDHRLRDSALARVGRGECGTAVSPNRRLPACWPSFARPLVFVPHLLFFFNDTATTEIYPLSLHDALPISYLVTLGLFILTCNLIGIIPSFESPTAVPVVPLGCALLTWFYYHFQIGR